MKHPYFRGLQEVNTNVNIVNPVSQEVEDQDEINEILEKHPQQNFAKQQDTQKQATQPTNNFKPQKKPSNQMKDSIDDFDDMLQDFEKKYSSSNIVTNNSNNINNNNNNNNSNNNNNNINRNLPKSGKNQTVGLNNSSKNINKTPQTINTNNSNSITNSNSNINNNNINNTLIRDSIFAQFKDDPIFSELLQTNTLANSSKNNLKNLNNEAMKSSNILNNNSNSHFLNSPLNNHLQRKNSMLDSNKMDTNLQKKKFDDLFNNFNETTAPAKTNYTKTNPFFNDKKNFEDILFDEENIKPSGKKLNNQNLNKPTNSNIANNNNTNNNNLNFFQEISGSNSNTNKRKGGINNPAKSGRKDILEELFGDDLFTGGRGHSPNMSKNRPQVSKLRNNTNKYDDIFSMNKNGNKGCLSLFEANF